MVSCYEYLVLIGQFYEPVQEVEHIFLCAIIADVTTVNDDIRPWHILYPVV
jgi:hypothetical protein